MARVPSHSWIVLPLLLPLTAASGLRNGTIEGRITLKERPAARVAARYDGPGGGAARVAPRVPAVVYIVGPVAGAPTPSARPKLAQKDTAFAPAVVVVTKGDTVDFPNQDPFFHNVFSYSKPKRFDLGRFPRGESKAVTFDQAGVVKVFCEVHKWMRAAVLVTENPYHAVVAEDGSFTIPDVPPGRYKLAVWDVDRGEKVFDVELPANAKLRFNASL